MTAGVCPGGAAVVPLSMRRIVFAATSPKSLCRKPRSNRSRRRQAPKVLSSARLFAGSRLR